MVDKIACRWWTACPQPIVLSLFIADTTVCRQYVNSNSSYAAKTKFVARNEIQIHLLETSNRDTSPGPPNFYFHDFYLYGLHVSFSFTFPALSGINQ